MTIEVKRNHLELIQINAPQWFENKEFIDFVLQPGVATWHYAGKEPDEYSDVFLFYGPQFNEEGAIPQFVVDDINKLGLERDLECILWITNLI